MLPVPHIGMLPTRYLLSYPPAGCRSSAISAPTGCLKRGFASETRLTCGRVSSYPTSSFGLIPGFNIVSTPAGYPSDTLSTCGRASRSQYCNLEWGNCQRAPTLSQVIATCRRGRGWRSWPSGCARCRASPYPCPVAGPVDQSPVGREGQHMSRPAPPTSLEIS